MRVRLPGALLVMAGGAPAPQELAAEATAGASVDAALRVGKPLAAEAAPSCVADAALLVPKRLAAEAASALAADAALRVAKPLAAAVSSGVVLDAALRVGKPLAASASIGATLDAALRVGKPLGAEVVVSATADASLGGAVLLFAEASGTVTAAAALLVGKPLSAEAAAALAADAALHVVKRLGAEAAVTLIAAALSGGAGPTTEIPVRTAIVDAIVAALAAASLTVRGHAVTVERSRTDMIEEAERPLLAVIAGDQEALPSDTLTQRYSLRIILAGYLAAGTEAQAETDAAELHARCVRALIRPDPEALPVALMLADGTTEVWLTEGGLRVEPVSVLESEAPLANCAMDFTAEVPSHWGNPFITA